jgi:hypothetical protein
VALPGGVHRSELGLATVLCRKTIRCTPPSCSRQRASSDTGGGYRRKSHRSGPLHQGTLPGAGSSCLAWSDPRRRTSQRPSARWGPLGCRDETSPQRHPKPLRASGHYHPLRGYYHPLRKMASHPEQICVGEIFTLSQSCGPQTNREPGNLPCMNLCAVVDHLSARNCGRSVGAKDGRSAGLSDTSQ